MRFLYYDCFAGISGDMNLGAMIDLGVDPEHLRRELARLQVDGYEILVRRERRRGVEGTRAEVVLHGGAHDQGHGHHVTAGPHDEHHELGAPHHEHHDRNQGELDSHHHSVVRSHGDIRALIQQSGLSGRVKALSLAIFSRIARAEGKIHCVVPDQVQFHEVGAVDSIVDIVGAAVCHEALGIEQVVAGPLELGSGMVRCVHGIFPVPAPATAEILKGIPVRTGGVPFEATTPTGAAVVAELARTFVSSVNLKIERVGYGLGAKDGPIPNALRIVIAETLGAEDAGREDGTATEEAVLVECNVDDMSPERYDHVMEVLFRGGAMDVFLTPIVMKKSRPAVTVSVLCGRETLASVRETLFTHTTTIGIRETVVSKRMLARREVTATTPLGDVRFKQALYRGAVLRSKPEYEDIKRLALKHRLSIDRVMDVVRTGEGEARDER